MADVPGDSPYLADLPRVRRDACRRLFVAAVRKEEREAYTEIQDFAAQLMERLGPDLAREREAQEREIQERRSRAAQDVPEAPTEGPLLAQLTVEIPWRYSPLASQEWQRFVGTWNKTHNLADPRNAWVAVWILRRVLVGRRERQGMGEYNKDVFGAMVPEAWVESVSVRLLAPVPVLPEYRVGVEGRQAYRRRVKAMIGKYMDAVEREAEGRGIKPLSRVRSKPNLWRDLRHLVLYQLRKDPLKVYALQSESYPYSDTSARLAEVAKLVGLARRGEADLTE